MLNKKYKSSSITIKGSNYPSGDASKSRKRDARGIRTHGAGLVDGMIKGSGENSLQSAKASSKAKARGVGTEKLEASGKEKMAKALAGLCPEKKVDNSSIKITMGAPKVTNTRQEVSGVYLNNRLHEIKTNFKRRK